tara:strand:+ start:310 stop:537 length:228 start_codon:yes stop_codon:yes gene_type:complete
MKKFKELREEISEDAPATSVANAPAGMVDEPIVKKKKKEDEEKRIPLIDGRTKSYRQHREKLEAQRERREQRKLK